MKRTLLIITIACISAASLLAQMRDVTPLFASQDPLHIKLKMTFKEFKKQTNDSTYMDGVIYYEENNGTWDSIKVELRTRGDFRLRECFFPPIRVKIKKGDAQGTIFEGNKALKLVMPCKKSKETNTLVLREYMCYKIYETVTPYTFNTRLLSIDLTEGTGKKADDYQLSGFFIEDDDLVAERHKAEVKELTLHPLSLHDTTAVRHDLFQYFIANIDWSTTFMHNAKIIQTTEPFRNIPLTYDFDQSGFVDASYATLNPEFNMTNVKDRIYRGFCRKDNAIVYYVRNQYIELEGAIFEIMRNYKSYFEEKEFTSTEKFASDFFKIMKSLHLTLIYLNVLVIKAPFTTYYIHASTTCMRKF